MRFQNRRDRVAYTFDVVRSCSRQALGKWEGDSQSAIQPIKTTSVTHRAQDRAEPSPTPCDVLMIDVLSLAKCRLSTKPKI